MNKINPSLRRGSIFKSFLCGTRIGLPTIFHKEVVVLLRGLGGVLVKGNTWVKCLASRMVALGVVIGVIR